MMCSLTEIQEDSSHKISYGQYLGKFCNTIVKRPSSSTKDPLSEIEREELDRAIALSIGGEHEKGKKIMDNDSHLVEDEQIAKALQEIVDLEKSPPKIPPTQNVGKGRICAGCSGEIIDESYLRSENGSVWHLRPECNCCHVCNLPISDLKKCFFHDNHLHHASCYKDLFKCDVCKNFVPTNAAGNFEYREHPFWHNKYCASHESGGTPRCCSCERMEAVDAEYLTLDDGRKLCLECLHSSIMATHECEPLYLEIRYFYEGLNMKVEQEFPLLLVEREALNEATEGEKNGRIYNPETRGLCLAEEQTVRTIVKRPNILGVRIKDMPTEPCRLVRKCEVTAILILYGLPRLLTGTIIAHEMMHAWLRLQGYPNLSPRVEEGICQVLAHRWLDPEIIAGSGSKAVSSDSSFSATSASSLSSSSGSSKKGKRSEFEKKLGKFFKYQIESDTSEVYGDGFRDGIKAVDKYGLKPTLNHIRYPNLSPDVEEGICQVLAHMWLDSEIIAGSGCNTEASSSSSSSSASPSSSVASSSSSGSSKKGKRSDFEKKLGEFFEHQIESDTSAAYGDGFREGNKTVLKYGLRRTLDHIRLTGSFPC